MTGFGEVLGERWEYRRVAMRDGFVDRLNELGQDGWEAVCAAGPLVLLKRRMP